VGVDGAPALDRHEVRVPPCEQRLEPLGIRLRRHRQPVGLEILDQAPDGLVGVALVRTEDSGRAALDPADRVDARQRLAVRAEHPSAFIGKDEGALVEGNPGKRHRPVADRPEYESTLDRLDVPLHGPGTDRSVVATDQLVAAYVDCLDPPVAADLDRGAQEPQHDPPSRAGAFGLVRELVEELDVLARGERSQLLEPAL